jgi:hypothetical protein
MGSVMHKKGAVTPMSYFQFQQMARLQPNVFFEQDGALQHWGLTVGEALNKTFPNR